MRKAFHFILLSHENRITMIHRSVPGRTSGLGQWSPAPKYLFRRDGFGLDSTVLGHTPHGWRRKFGRVYPADEFTWRKNKLSSVWVAETLPLVKYSRIYREFPASVPEKSVRVSQVRHFRTPSSKAVVGQRFQLAVSYSLSPHWSPDRLTATSSTTQAVYWILWQPDLHKMDTVWN